MEGILAIIFLFGGGALVGISYSPVGKAVAARIRGDSAPASGPDPEVLAELDSIRTELSEVHERLDFAERLLAANREAGKLPEGTP